MVLYPHHLFVHNFKKTSLLKVRLDFPPDHSKGNRTYLIQQLRHREPIAYGINQWMPKTVFEDPGMQRWLQLLNDPVRRSQNRDQPPIPITWLSKSDEPTRLANMGLSGWLFIDNSYRLMNRTDCDLLWIVNWVFQVLSLQTFGCIR